MVHKQFHMVPSVRRAALTTTAIARLSSFLDIVSTLLSPFPGLASQSVYASVPTIGLCLRDCYIRPPTITPPLARFEREKRGAEMREKESSIIVTRRRRSSFSSDEHKSLVMTDRRRSDPSYNHHASHREKMSRVWRSVAKEFPSCTEALV